MEFINLDDTHVQVRRPCPACEGKPRSLGCLACASTRYRVEWVSTDVFVNSVAERVQIAVKAKVTRELLTQAE